MPLIKTSRQEEKGESAGTYESQSLTHESLYTEYTCSMCSKDEVCTDLETANWQL